MNVSGKKVSHSKFGEGKIVEQSENAIQIEFSEETKTFQYPFCFEKFITFVGKDVPDVILEEIKTLKEEEQKVKEENDLRIQDIIRPIVKVPVRKKKKVWF